MRSGWERHGAVYRIVDEPGRCDVRGAVPAGRAGLSWNLYFKLVRWPMPDVEHFDPDTGSGDSGAAVLAPRRRLDWNPGRRGSVRPQPVQPLLHLRQQAGAVRSVAAPLPQAALAADLPASRRGRARAAGRRGVLLRLDHGALLGEYARWGCMVSNAHAVSENADDAVAQVLDQHHQGLRDALHAALVTAQARGQLTEDADPAATADVLALVAYGVNLRSRAGASARSLQHSVTTALASIAPLAAQPAPTLSGPGESRVTRVLSPRLSLSILQCAVPATAWGRAAWTPLSPVSPVSAV